MKKKLDRSYSITVRISSISAQKEHDVLKKILVLPLNKILAIVRTILKYKRMRSYYDGYMMMKMTRGNWDLLSVLPKLLLLLSTLS